MRSKAPSPVIRSQRSMYMQSKTLTGAEAILEATDLVMEEDEKVIVIGEGVPDPKGIFGTTLGLQEKYGANRVFDMPVSENGVTGICIGASLKGWRPIMTHQRVDFALYALEQIINNAAKWHFMFSSQQTVPIVVRMVIGRGWGQGAQHSQNLQALFAHIPGLKVVMPAFPADAKGLLMASIKDNNPVIFIEHRWIHNIKGEVKPGSFAVPLGKARVVQRGRDVTIVANSYMTVEALRAAKLLGKHGIRVELIDLRTIKPLDTETIIKSVAKTGRLLAVDSGWITGGIAGEVVAMITTRIFDKLKAAPTRIALRDIPTPSSPGLTKGFYNTYRDIVESVFELVGRDVGELKKVWQAEDRENKVPHDVPDKSFTGPF